jgi:O-acetyl-ADP-ribose deacetylase (regulator of RNase III)
MHLSITLVDVNPRLVAAWQVAFSDAPEVAVVHGSLLQQRADAWVTPTNSRGRMDGGVDAVLVRYLGSGLQARVQREIGQQFGGRMPVGCAACVSTLGLHAPPTAPQPRYVIAAPTMTGSSEDVSRTDHAGRAFAAALQVALACDAAARDTSDWAVSAIRSIAVPGLGTSTGRLGVRDCAEQMRLAYELFRERTHAFADFDAIGAAVESQLGIPPTAPPPPPTTRTYYRHPRPKRRLFGLLSGG